MSKVLLIVVTEMETSVGKTLCELSQEWSSTWLL